jgi:hypothetical protein
MEKTLSISGKPLAPEAIAVPCGLVAKYYFNGIFLFQLSDTFRITLPNDS